MEREYFSAPFEPGRPRPKRPVTDYGSTYLRWMQHRRPKYRGATFLEAERPSASYIVDMLPPAARPMNAADTVPVKCLHSSLNKIKHSINVVRWTPEGRRLLTGAQSGEFTLWNGMGFNFETIMQAHDTYIRDAKYSHSGDWLLSADQDGTLKYWQPNFNNVKIVKAHDDAVHEVSFSPTDSKFVTASHDTTLKIWDFAGGVEESVLRGHGWEAKCVDWHPTKGLIVSGSKDHQIKLWDPRTSRCLTTLHGHKNTIQKTKFEPNQGDMLATCARDHIARIFDIRMMRDVLLLRGHEKDITTLVWHPIHKNLLTTGGIDGSIYHYLLDEQHAPPESGPSLSPFESADPVNAPAQTIYPAHKVQNAHEYTVWTLDWHPLGHIMASGSQDKATRFWTRARPGDVSYRNDRYHIGQSAAEALGTWNRRDAQRQEREEQEEAEDEAQGLVDQKMPTKQSVLPVLPGLAGLAGLPGLPGLSGAHDGTSVGGGQLPGIGGPAPPFPPAGAIPPLPPNFDPSTLAQLGIPPPFVPPPNVTPGAIPPPPPGMLPLGFQLPPGFVPPPPGIPLPLPPVDINDPNGVRKRAPLPSQKESLAAEMRKGNYLKQR